MNGSNNNTILYDNNGRSSALKVSMMMMDEEEGNEEGNESGKVLLFKKHGRNLRIENEGKSISYAEREFKSEGWSTCLSTNKCYYGMLKKWYLRIDFSKFNNILIGITKEDTNLDDRIDYAKMNCKGGWCYNCSDGCFYGDGKSFPCSFTFSSDTLEEVMMNSTNNRSSNNSSSSSLLSSSSLSLFERNNKFFHSTSGDIITVTLDLRIDYSLNNNFNEILTFEKNGELLGIIPLTIYNENNNTFIHEEDNNMVDGFYCAISLIDFGDQVSLLNEEEALRILKQKELLRNKTHYDNHNNYYNQNSTIMKSKSPTKLKAIISPKKTINYASPTANSKIRSNNNTTITLLNMLQQ
ncbi:hypothetical protein ABK040_007939 [Willaertia magna]